MCRRPPPPHLRREERRAKDRERNTGNWISRQGCRSQLLLDALAVVIIVPIPLVRGRKKNEKSRSKPKRGKNLETGELIAARSSLASQGLWILSPASLWHPTQDTRKLWKLACHPWNVDCLFPRHQWPLPPALVWSAAFVYKAWKGKISKITAGVGKMMVMMMMMRWPKRAPADKVTTSLSLLKWVGPNESLSLSSPCQ